MKRLLAFAVFYWITAGFILPVFAEDLPAQGDADKFLKQQQQQRLEQERLRPPAQLQPTLPEAGDQPVEESPCFHISTLHIIGNTQLSETLLSSLRKNFTGRCLGVKSINNLLATINRAYIRAGFITSRAYLPRQDLKSGTLNVEILEGTVEDIAQNKKASRQDRWQLFFAMPQQKNELLELRSLEQGLDQINRLSSSRASLKLWPGSVPGATIVEIDNSRQDQTRIYAGWDNQGQTTTGETRSRLGIERDNGIGIGDAWSLYYIGSRNSNALALNLSVPWRFWIFNYSEAYSEYLSLVTPVAELFGRSHTQTLEADRVLSRDQRINRHAKFRLSHHEADRYVAGVRLQPQALTVVATGVSQTWRGQSTFLAGEINAARGISDWGGMQDRYSGDLYPHAQFNKLQWQASWFQALTPRWQYRAKIAGQVSDASLYSSEQISVGDAATVRGYEESPVSGDSGTYWQNELHFGFLPLDPLPDTAPTVEKWLHEAKSQLKYSTFYGFFDVSKTHSRANEESTRLSGAGLGYRFGGRIISFDVSAAHALDPQENARRSAVYASVNLKLN